MEQIKKQLEEVSIKLEAGKITEAEAHIAIAEITTSMPEEADTSEGVKGFMLDEINKMEISEDEKQTLRSHLDRE